MSRARTLSVFVALIALVSALAACGSGGGSDSPQSIVDEATLQGVESGKADLAVDVGIKGKKGGNVKVNLSGVFQGQEEAEYPELDLSLAVKGSFDGKKLDRDGGFTLLGNKAYVGYEGTEYEVDSTTFNFVKSMVKQQGGGKNQSSGIATCQEAAGGLELADFVDNLKDEGSAEVGGTETTKISGDLNASSAVEAASEILDDPACGKQLSDATPLPSAAELDKAKGTVKDSVKSAHAEIYVGDDHIIRRITAQATIEPPKGSNGSTKSVDLNLDLTLTGVNEDQTVSAPRSARPLSELFVKLGVNPIELLGALQNGGSSQGLGNLLESFGSAGGGSSGGGSGGGGGGGSGGGQQSYYECLGEAQTPVDIQNCTGLLQ